jgi:hypothetical protein
VGARQRACSKTCGATLRKKTQRRWRAQNADYAIAWRIQKRAQSSTTAAPRMPRPLSRLPWDVAKDEFGAQGRDFLAAFGRLLVVVAKDEMRSQELQITAVSGGLRPGAAKAEIGGMAG